MWLITKKSSEAEFSSKIQDEIEIKFDSENEATPPVFVALFLLMKL